MTAMADGSDTDEMWQDFHVALDLANDPLLQSVAPEQEHQEEDEMPDMDTVLEAAEGDHTSTGIKRYRGEEIVLPRRLSIEDAIKQLEAQQDSAGTMFQRRYRYRPLDGAFAVREVMRKRYSAAGIGAAIKTMFGSIPPQRVSVQVDLNEHAQVPWGDVIVPSLGKLSVGQTHDAEVGMLFHLAVEAPSDAGPRVEEFFDSVETELKEHSIYRGKAIDGQEVPEFLDLAGVDPDQVVYSADAATQLNANLWAPLEKSDLLAELGLPKKRRVLLEGPYGTGKTLAAFLTAQKAVANGWGFIYCRPQDDLKQVMATARLYPPAIVFYEDIDRLTDSGSPERATELLDVFDGMKAKPADVMVIATTNHVDRLHKGMLRAGRIDAVIRVEELDGPSARLLVEKVVKPGLLADVDLAEVGEAMSGLTPASVREAAERAVRYAVARENDAELTLRTEDLTLAAKEMRDQKALQDEALEDHRPRGFGAAFETAVTGSVERAVRGVPLVDIDGDETGTYLASPERNGTG